ncbi:hypothetical protein HU200_010566 [Digitaria exilis]|uniref:Uncharacterized protein n=1 Tax=Digitaria exilis TaxID=1010633 RepID=A0A835KM31_9POAL|nr:hypothetical protein HU200_010566 [Digitaria exilis]
MLLYPSRSPSTAACGPSGTPRSRSTRHSSATKRMCVCPLPCCGYASLKLRDRIQGTHAVAAPSGGGDHVVVSLVGSPEVMLRHRTPFVVLLQETDVCVLLLLNGGNVSSGLSLSVVCVGPRLGGNKSLEYELQVGGPGAGRTGSLALSASGPVACAACTRIWAGHHPTEGSCWCPTRTGTPPAPSLSARHRTRSC